MCAAPVSGWELGRPLLRTECLVMHLEFCVGDFVSSLLFINLLNLFLCQCEFTVH